MDAIRTLAEAAWRDHTIQGQPSSGKHEVNKLEVRSLFQLLAALVDPSAISASISAQPNGPAIGDLYILATSPSGAAWGSYSAGNIAVYLETGWVQVPPSNGLTVFIQDEGVHRYRDGASWADFVAEPGARTITVRAATTANITLSGEQTIDGVALVAGQAALVKDQTTASQNGVYIVSVGGWSRAPQFDNWVEIPGAIVTVQEGTANHETAWQSAADLGGTLGTTAITFAEVTGGAALAEHVAAANPHTQYKLKSEISANGGTLINETFAQMRASLDLEPGVDFYSITATDALLTTINDAITTLTSSVAGKQTHTTNLDAWSGVNPSANVLSIVGAANFGAIRVLLSLVPGTDFYSVSATDTLLAGKQAASANLTSYAGVAPHANALTLLAHTFTQMKSDLGLVIGTDVQAYSANLTSYAGVSPHANALTLLGHSFAQMKTDLGLVAGTDFYSKTGADAQFLALSGGTLSGPLTLSGDPTLALHPATKQYVDNLAAGLDVKASVLCASTANLTLSGTQTIDGVSAGVGARVLVKDQTAPAENGIYVVASGAWTRATDADAWAELPGAHVWVEEGSTNSDRAYACTSNTGGTLNTTAVTWTQFGGTGAYQAASANLSIWAAINPSANVQSLVGAANYGAMRTLLSLVVGTDVQAYSANLTTYAGIAPHADAQTLLAHSFSQMRTDLGLVIGTNVQAYSANLASWSALAPSAKLDAVLANNTFSKGRNAANSADKNIAKINAQDFIEFGGVQSYDNYGSHTNRGAAVEQVTFANLAPTAVHYAKWMAVVGKGDNTGFKGVGGHFIAAIDDPGVTSDSLRGVLYCLGLSVQPARSRNNAPHDDAACLVGQNDGAGQATELFFAGRGAGALSVEAIAALGIQCNAEAAIWAIAAFGYGMDFSRGLASPATFTNAGIRFPNNMTALTARNNANSADHGMIGHNTSDQVTLDGKIITPWADWTPTVSAITGSFTTAAGVSGECRWCQINNIVFVKALILITTKNTGVGLRFTLPVLPAKRAVLSGMELSQGFMIRGNIVGGSTNCDVYFYNAGDADANGDYYVLEGFYEV